jgi:peptide/nickel transport system ATP-binding protein
MTADPQPTAEERPAAAVAQSLDKGSITDLVTESQRKRRGRVGEVLLDVRKLKTSFYTREGAVRAVTGVDLQVRRGEILGLVGESGCGKSVTSLSIMRLVAPPGKVESGEVVFDGEDLLKIPDKKMRSIRGNRISMIFQQPTSALNPVLTVGAQIGEVLEIHRQMKRKAALQRALELLEMVGIPDPERRLAAYPHEMSGGMAQRVMIAMALACEPELLIADEPTTALDVTIQAQILDLMRRLQSDLGTAIVLITHDLGVVAEMCDRVAVMYAGEIIEHTDTRTLFRQPLHPYTQGLIGAVPVLGQTKETLTVIPGMVPNLIDLPDGCRFADRCISREKYEVDPARKVHPELELLTADGQTHEVRCWLYHTDERTGDWKPPLAGGTPAEKAGTTPSLAEAAT